MAGDEIVADWLGDVHASKVTTSTTVQRLSSTSLRFRSVYIHNWTSPSTAEIGKYLPAASFSLYSQFLGAKGTLHYEFVDLYELGCLKYGISASDLRILGINKY